MYCIYITERRHVGVGDVRFGHGGNSCPSHLDRLRSALASRAIDSTTITTTTTTTTTTATIVTCPGHRIAAT